jgi:hypothetical protein
VASTNYLDYPVGSPERAQLQAAEHAENLRRAEQEYARARARRDEQQSLVTAQRTQREREQRERRHPSTPEPGLMTRLGDIIVRGFGKSAQSPFGFAWDLARAGFRDDQSILGELPESFSERFGAQQLNAWFGPRGVGGSLIGLVPRGVRDVAHAGMQPVGEALAATRREAIVEPLTRLLTGHNPFGGLSNLEDFDDPQIANTLGRVVTSWWDGDSSKGWSQVISGGIDLASAIFLDPAAAAGKGAAAAKGKVLESAGYGQIRTAEGLAHVVRSGAFTDFTERAIVGKTPYEIFNTHLSQHPNGMALATALHEANRAAGVEGVRLATRSMLGDPEAAAQLVQRAEDAAVILDNVSVQLNGAQEAMRAVRSEQAAVGQQMSLFTPPSSVAGVEAATEALTVQKASAVRELAMAERAKVMHGMLDRLPRQTTAGQVRLSERFGARSDWYQASPWARPVHVVFDRLPKNRVNLNNPTSAVDLDRMLRAARMEPERAGKWMDRYGAAVNTTERRAVFEEAETAAITHLADQAGLSFDDLDKLLEGQRNGRASLSRTLEQRIYGGNGRDLLVLDDADRPLTQVHTDFGGGRPDELRLADFHQVRRVVTKWGQFKARHPSVGIPVAMLHEYNDIWRPAQLLRIATPATIQMDQQLRIYLKLGGLNQVGSILGRGTRYLWDTAKGVEDEARGIRPFEYRGVTGPGPWGTTTEQAALTKALNSSRGVQKMLDAGEIGQRKLFGSGIEDMGRTIYPTEPRHAQELARVLNNEIGDDAVNRMLLEGRSVDEVTAWFDTPEGQAYTAEIPLKRRNPRAWVEARAQHVEDMTGGSAELRALALDRNVKALDVETSLPDPATRPLVNRLLSDNLTGKSQTIRAVNKIVDGFFRVVHSWPDDVLSRNTLYTELYDSEMRRLVDVFASSRKGNIGVPDATLQQFSQVARTKALAETKSLLYDLADQSRAAEVFRFVIPFFEPVREQITVYGQLASAAPQRFARVRALLRAPLRAGYVYDENGNRITESGRHVDPLTGEEVPESERGTRQMLRFQLPEWTRGLPYFGEVLGGRTQTIDLGTIREKTTFPTKFGWGPIVQIPVNQTARKRPGLEESMKFLLPYGVRDESILRQLEPGFLKKWSDAANRDDDNRTQRGVEAAQMIHKLTEFRLTNGRAPDDTEKAKLEAEAVDEADKFMKLRFGVAYVFPFAVGFESPYKPYADAYRAAMSAWQDGEARRKETGEPNLVLADAEGNERDPTQWFLDTFGDEFFAMTQSVTRSTNGVPATIEGMAAEAKYRDLIQAHPDLTGIVIGNEGVGEFNRTVFGQQLGTERAPGADENMREFLPLAGRPGRPGISTASDIDLGWHDYLAGMDLIDAERKKRGLPNLQIKAATDLAEAKRAFVEQLKVDYRAWADEFEDTDRGKWRRKVDGLEKIVADPRLAQRQEIQLLGTYLEGRDWIRAELERRPSKGLDSRANMDLALKWEDFTSNLVDQNLAFADLFNRHLSNDPVTDQ